MTERDTDGNRAQMAPGARYVRLTPLSISAGRPFGIGMLITVKSPPMVAEYEAQVECPEVSSVGPHRTESRGDSSCRSVTMQWPVGPKGRLTSAGSVRGGASKVVCPQGLSFVLLHPTSCSELSVDAGAAVHALCAGAQNEVFDRSHPSRSFPPVM